MKYSSLETINLDNNLKKNLFTNSRTIVLTLIESFSSHLRMHAPILYANNQIFAYNILTGGLNRSLNSEMLFSKKYELISLTVCYAH